MLHGLLCRIQCFLNGGGWLLPMLFPKVAILMLCACRTTPYTLPMVFYCAVFLVCLPGVVHVLMRVDEVARLFWPAHVQVLVYYTYPRSHIATHPWSHRHTLVSLFVPYNCPS